MLRTTLEQVNQTHLQTTNAGKTLSYYAYLIEHLEDKHFQSDKLQTLSSALDTDAKKASARLKRLSYIIHHSTFGITHLLSFLIHLPFGICIG